jgi:hypothetical protein
MSEVREKLKPFVGKRIKVRGALVSFADWIRNYRDVGRACISCPEHNGDVLAEHVWVTDVPHWLNYKCNLGAQVEFTAVVKRYLDRDSGVNYCLTNADDLVLLHNPPALAIPDPPEEEIPQSEQNDSPPPEAVNDKVVGDPLETIREVKRFCKDCGGFDQAERMAEAMKALTIPIPQLIAWIKALREE